MQTVVCKGSTETKVLHIHVPFYMLPTSILLSEIKNPQYYLRSFKKNTVFLSNARKAIKLAKVDSGELHFLLMSQNFIILK